MYQISRDRAETSWSARNDSGPRADAAGGTGGRDAGGTPDPRLDDADRHDSRAPLRMGEVRQIRADAERLDDLRRFVALIHGPFEPRGRNGRRGVTRVVTRRGIERGVSTRLLPR